MTDILGARCHCGRIHLRLPASAVGVLACHCDDCQKMHGNFNAFVAVARADIAVTGEEALVWYQSSDASRRAFCGTCGARVVKEITAAGRWLVSAGLIEGPTGKRIIRNLWEQSKPDWYDLPGVAP
ncbi:GFA family protein [Paragemmobacter straminiformis]|uniref:GFA family protein n=1 Tax=Paragemmobacter straminiformis TaxID=2045119 RepID=A0A842I024_9RHOB|nr:GFA family protein [Gemmobacter straminiformis]MBC2834042.1 GFA family protein [Gemmobacter straminiformis]